MLTAWNKTAFRWAYLKSPLMCLIPWLIRDRIELCQMGTFHSHLGTSKNPILHSTLSLSSKMEHQNRSSSLGMSRLEKKLRVMLRWKIKPTLVSSHQVVYIKVKSTLPKFKVLIQKMKIKILSTYWRGLYYLSSLHLLVSSMRSYMNHWSMRRVKNNRRNLYRMRLEGLSNSNHRHNLN
jgi:hypothetical protein